MTAIPMLIVDDNPQNLKLARVLFAGRGYQVRTATDGEEALKILETFSPRVILMDIQLPGVDGLELTRKLKADPHTRGIVIIALTAYAMKGDAERMHAAGCDAYAAKPIDVKTLPEFVAGVLAGANAVLN